MKSIFLRDAIDLAREIERIDAVEKFEERQRVTNFVFLEMPHEMPAQVRRQLRNLGARFLHAAFTENLLPAFMSRAHFFGVVGF